MNRASFVCQSGPCSFSLGPQTLPFHKGTYEYLLAWYETDARTQRVLFLLLAHGNTVFLRLKQFTVLIPPNTTHCLLYSLYTLIKTSYFLKHYAAGKIFRCFSYDFSFYMKSVSTTLSVILSKQQDIIVTLLYLLSVSVSMKRKYMPYPLFSTIQ
jgi:hypothetical protein